MKNVKNNGALPGAMLGGALMVVAGMLTRAWAGAPYEGILRMGLGEVIPPVWLMTLLWLLWYFGLGATCGGVLTVHGGCSVTAWRGACFFLLMAGLGFLWYPLFFLRNALGLCILICLVLIALCVLCAINWQNLSLVAAAFLYLHALWLLYLLILQVICIFYT